MQNYKFIANPDIVFREEDEWGILFNPDTGDTYGLNSISVFIWTHFDGNRAISDIIFELRKTCNNVPNNAEKYVYDFIKDLKKNNLIK